MSEALRMEWYGWVPGSLLEGPSQQTSRTYYLIAWMAMVSNIQKLATSPQQMKDKLAEPVGRPKLLGKYHQPETPENTKLLAHESAFIELIHTGPEPM